MALLNQVIALVKGEKNRAETSFTKVHHDSQRAEPLSGLTRVYRRKDDEGDVYPNEGNAVQITVDNLLDRASKSLSRLFDLTATLETGNTAAKADVIIDGTVLLANVPVTYLLFLEKKLVDISTFVSKLPLLDPSVEWEFDSTTGTYRSPVTTTVKSKKVPKAFVLYEATEKHPAQVQPYQEDVLVGYWDTTRFSGAIPATRSSELLERVRKLTDAVKVARERANSTEVDNVKVSNVVFGYLFA